MLWQPKLTIFSTKSLDYFILLLLTLFTMPSPRNLDCPLQIFWVLCIVPILQGVKTIWNGDPGFSTKIIFYNRRFSKFLTSFKFTLFFDRSGVDNTNYYYPGVVPSHAKTHDTMLTTLGHRFISSESRLKWNVLLILIGIQTASSHWVVKYELTYPVSHCPVGGTSFRMGLAISLIKKHGLAIYS